MLTVSLNTGFGPEKKIVLAARHESLTPGQVSCIIGSRAIGFNILDACEEHSTRPFGRSLVRPLPLNFLSRAVMLLIAFTSKPAPTVRAWGIRSGGKFVTMLPFL